MIYGFLRLVVPVAIRVFYKNFYIRNAQNLPFGIPVIIASNHPNAVIDACAITAFTKQHSHYLARGDAFKKKFFRWLLTRMGLVPIYRLQEGAENLHLNQQTFQICFDLLRKKKTILIFSEGLCIQERRLRKLKKGTARIAFSAEEIFNWDLGLVVVPVGMNYSDPKKFRSTLVVNYGEPIRMKSFQELYLKDKAAAINEFTRHLQNKLSELVVHINNKDNDELVADIEEIIHEQAVQQSARNISGDEIRFVTTRKIVDTINLAGENRAERVAFLKNKIRDYFAQLAQIRTKDRMVRGYAERPFHLSSFIYYFLLLLVGFPFHLFGLINNYLPYKIAYTTADRVAKEVEFHATVNAVLGLLLYVVFYPLQILAVALIFHNWYYLATYIFLLPLSGWFSLHYYSYTKRTLRRWRFFAFRRKNPSSADKVIALRKEIVNTLRSEFDL
ncbi:MAG TPA: 1-acyl-sn-glycerol-3-phosphate acyltransferase [Bacteroidia bacterium]